MSTQLAPPFRFLDLPSELRIMVYERLPFTTRQHTFNFLHSLATNESAREDDLTITLVVKSLPMALLRTCQLVQSEATSILAAKSKQLRAEPMRLIVGATNILPLFGPRGLFYTAVDYQLSLRRAANPSTEIDEVHLRSCIKMALHFPPAVLNRPDDFASLSQFIAKCVEYLHDRTPPSTVMAIQRRSSYDLRRTMNQLCHAVEDMAAFRTLPPQPVGFMLRRVYTDDFDDPPSSRYPGGVLWDNWFSWGTNPDGSSSFFQVEDADWEEWGRVWEEGEHYELN